MKNAAAALLASIVLACTPKFYVMHQVRLDAVQTAPASSPAATGGAKEEPLEPYLTQTAVGHTENFFKATRDFSSDLKVFKLDAEFNLPDGGKTSSVIMAYDLHAATDHAALGREVIKSIPMPQASTTALNMTISSSAVEKNLADQFVNALNIVNQAPVFAGALGPQLTEALSASSQVLKIFQSPKDGTKSSKVITLNPTAGELESQTQVFVFVPTGDQGAGEHLPADPVFPQDEKVDAVARTHSYAQRISKLQASSFALCANDSKVLCTVGAGHAQSTFDDYAYLVLKPSISYRIVFPEFIWPSLASGGSCPFDRKALNSYRNRIAEVRTRLTGQQAGMEDEIAGTAESLLTVREVAAASDASAVFGALRSEWLKGSPRGPLYSLSDKAGRSYKEVQADLRGCAVAAAEAKQGAAVGSYVAALEELTAADAQRIPQSATDADATAGRYEKVLDLLVGLSAELDALKIASPQLSAELAYDVTWSGIRIFDLQFREPIRVLSSAGAAAGAPVRARLASLVSNTRCAVCRERAQKALTDSAQVTPNGPADSVVRSAVAAAAQANDLGARLALKESLLEFQKLPADQATRDAALQQLANVRLSTENLLNGKSKSLGDTDRKLQAVGSLVAAFGASK